ncbi:MAG: phage portal protein [Paraburkholderia sp.]|uniref:phage portal protein n=1 Tax=Paraburkholderia sp. TaxID=1926495 RepID=UPI000E7710D9
MVVKAYPSLRQRGFVLPRAAYEAGGTSGSRTRNWRTSGAGPTSAVAQNLNTLRSRARDAIRNDPWAKSTIAKLVSSAIGTGIRPYPKHPDKATRQRLTELWDDWAIEADADGRLDIYGLQSLAARGMFGDGEGLVRMRSRRPEDGLSVPLQLQALEADHLPSEKTESLANGNRIICGVEYSQIGRRVAYHLWNQHPGDYGLAPRTGLALTRVPAEQIIHLHQIDRAGQNRGVTVLATVLLRLKSLDDFDDAVLVRQGMANLFTGFVTRQAPDGAVAPAPAVQYDAFGNPTVADEDGYTPIASLEPGLLQELDPGDTVTWSDPPDAGDNYSEFMRQQLMAAAASAGLPYELLTGDLRGVSDRALRVILNEFRRSVEQLLWGTFIHQYCRPIWAAVMDAAVLVGELPAQDYQRNRRLFLRAEWVPHGWAYIHPVQDVQARALEVEKGFRSRSSVILSGGDTPESVDADIAADRQREKELGLSFGTSSTAREAARDSQDEQ